MEVINLLNFLNKAQKLHTLEYATFDDELINFLDLMLEDEQFTVSIDLGIVYVSQKNLDEYTIVDGLNRILSLSLLLHAVCECYKKTTTQNENAIKTIRKKYLLKGNHLKLQLNDEYSEVYAKIINGERLSEHEKNTPLFRLMHNLWSQIKDEKLQAAQIFKMLNKVKITVVDTQDVSKRDLYRALNANRKLNQLALIENYLKEQKCSNLWSNIDKQFSFNDSDIKLFFKDFFITKFNYKKFDELRLYDNFVNYFETMLQYIAPDVLVQRMSRAARLYYDILQVNFSSIDVKRAFIKVKKCGGEDTFAYILDVYDDYLQNNISEDTFIEILNTIAEYLKNRNINENGVEFNELIKYLNAFITCK